MTAVWFPLRYAYGGENGGDPLVMRDNIRRLPG